MALRLHLIAVMLILCSLAHAEVITASMYTWPQPVQAPGAKGEAPVRLKVMVVAFDPIVKSQGGKRLHEVEKWNDPLEEARQYVADLRRASGGYVRYEIVEAVVYDGLPIMTDGYQYTPEDYISDWAKRKPHQPEQVDFKVFATDKLRYPFNRKKTVAERVAAKEIDEVFCFSPPGAGAFYESAMAGPRPFFINGSVFPCDESKRNFAIMGFNYERGVDCMLENFCHRTECCIRREYEGASAKEKNNWQKFSSYDKIAPGEAGCGNCHFAPSSQRDYDWGNKTAVSTTCTDWYKNWPNLKGDKIIANCAEWGNGDMRLHHLWWLSHVPNRPGVNPDGKLNNWWRYIVDLDYNDTMHRKLLVLCQLIQEN